MQLAGWDPQIMAEAARIAADLGATFIDINMGCPAKKVTAAFRIRADARRAACRRHS